MSWYFAKFTNSRILIARCSLVCYFSEFEGRDFDGIFLSDSRESEEFYFLLLWVISILFIIYISFYNVSNFFVLSSELTRGEKAATADGDWEDLS